MKEVKQKYTLATKAADLESVVVSGAFSVLMIVWACLTEDKRFLFIPLICLTVAFICLSLCYLDLSQSQKSQYRRMLTVSISIFVTIK